MIVAVSLWVLYLRVREVFSCLATLCWPDKACQPGAFKAVVGPSSCRNSLCSYQLLIAASLWMLCGMLCQMLRV